MNRRLNGASVPPTMLLAAMMAVGAQHASAQVKPPPVTKACSRIDTAASWYRRQAEWWALDNKHDWSNDSVRTQLLAAVALIEPPSHERFPIQLGASNDRAVVSTLPADSLRKILGPARQTLNDLAKKRTWALRSTVGPAGVRAAWLIAAGDSALTNTTMHRMMEAGPGEVSPTDVAVLEDWLRLKTGRKQIYATRVHTATDRSGREVLEPDPTEDLPHVDLRRDAAGLPPLAFALCYAEARPHF